MCGIAGVASSHPSMSVEAGTLQRMVDIVRYRGPDSSGFHLGPGIGLGVARLAINDLETGDQPIKNEDETVTVVCNGEIYNFHELRQKLLARGHRFKSKSDVEVIVHLYEDEGIECLKQLRGMFAFALWDARRRRLMLARDRLGIKPLHYAIGKEGCSFASELKSILIAGQVERRLDPEALRDFLTVGLVLTPRTLFTEVRRLPPGHYLLYQDGRSSLHQYWEVTFPRRGEEDHSENADTWAEPLRDKLAECVRIHLRSDTPIGAWLSPGLDSSSVASLTARFTAEPVRTFTLGFEDPAADEVSKNSTLDDFSGSRLSGTLTICKASDFQLFAKAVWHCEDPSSVGIEIPRLLLSESASKSVKVVMTGEGSDEIFGGYGRYKIDKLFRPLAALPLSLRQLMLLGPVLPTYRPWLSRMYLAPARMNRERYTRMLGPLHPEANYRLLAPALREQLNNAGPVCDIPRPADFERWHPLTQLQYYDYKIWLLDHINHHVDRASMAYSLEARLPFLDHELVELCARIPPALKMRGLHEKYVLRRAMRGLLPWEILTRRKRGMTAPARQWLRGELPEFAAELLSKEALRSKGYFDPEIVTDLIAQHRCGTVNYTRQLLSVLWIQLWDDLFMQGCRAA